MSLIAFFKWAPDWWKFSFWLLVKSCKRIFKPRLEWEVWDVPVHEGQPNSLVIFRVTNCSSKELKNISLSLETIYGEIKEASISILPLLPIWGRIHLDQLVFNEVTLARKPRRRAIEFDLSPNGSWRVEVSLPFASNCSPLSLFKYYEFSCPGAKISQKQRR